jgi:thiamine biosynthesis lipoprotein
MGTTVSIDVRPPLVAPEAIERAVAWFQDVDRRFSLYRRDSEMHRVADGRLPLDQASRDVRAIVSLADALRDRTDGYFDARCHRQDGLLDPTGVVKGWSVDEALTLLRMAGAHNLQIGAGGDLVVAGTPETGRHWRIGIRHPERHTSLAAVLEVSDAAVATSASYERGDHIRDPHTGRAAAGLRSLTVVGPTLTLADAFATAGFAMGEQGIAWVASQPGFGALGITLDDRLVWSPMVDGMLAGSETEPPGSLTAISGADA